MKPDLKEYVVGDLSCMGNLKKQRIGGNIDIRYYLVKNIFEGQLSLSLSLRSDI